MAAPTGSAGESSAAVESVYAVMESRQAESHPNAPALFEAVKAGDCEQTEALLSSGVPADSVDQDAATPLIHAAEGEPSIVSALLKRGVNVNHQNREGATALIVAVKFEDAEVVAMLLAHGASSDLTDVAGFSALDHAKEGGDAGVLDKFGISVEREPVPKGVAAQGRRNSVSSESIDPKAKLDMSAIPRIDKDEATTARIKATVQNSLLFKSLDSEQMEAVILSMAEVRVPGGEAVITQGDEGDHFYIVDSGKLDCFVKKADDGQDARGKKVLTYEAGATFGELALMYNTPRAASVVATSDTALWAMGRETFRTILLNMMCQKRLRFESLLETVPLLRSMEAYERTAVADAFEEATFPPGARLLREGDVGDRFYLLVKGAAVASIQGDAGPKQMLEYKEGDYFGELALLNKNPRAASVECITDCTVVSLDCPSFERLLGPVLHILKRNAENYKSYAELSS